MKFPAEAFRGFAAWAESMAGHEVVPALGALAMGDNLAVEIANSAHEGVLKQLAGGLREDEQIIHRAPFPRG
eukprot:5348414-Lingulodinium_polyedra.AAC.1